MCVSVCASTVRSQEAGRNTSEQNLKEKKLWKIAKLTLKQVNLCVPTKPAT